MNVLQLQYFCAVARSGHLSKTAESLHIAQPSLSKSIQRLEHELGVELFDRAGGGMRLNAFGRAWLAHAEAMLAEYEAGLDEVSRLRRSEQQNVTISFRSAAMLTTEVLALIAEACPGINMRVSSHGGDSQLSITCGPVPQSSKNRSTILHETILVALPKNHPLAHKRILNRQDVSLLSFVMQTEDNPISSTIDYYLDKYGIAINSGMVVDSPNLLRELSATGGYAAFIPALTWYKFSERSVSLHAIEGVTMDKYLYLETADGAIENANVRACKKVITDYFASLQDHVSKAATI